MEAFALESHRRAIRAIDEGRFAREIAPLGELRVDEGPRRDTSLEKMATLQPLAPEGRITAAVVEPDLRRRRRDPRRLRARRARARPQAARAHRPPERPRRRSHLDAHRPHPRDAPRAGEGGHDASTRSISSRSTRPSRASSSPGQKELGADLARVNVNGGAIALGHPLGATGARLMTTLAPRARAERASAAGLQTMCEGGGQANVTIVERLS